jgi:hypothetical protein
MNYKVEKVLKDNKKYIIVFLIVWLIIDILLIAPLSVAISNSLVNGKADFNNILEKFVTELTSFTSFTRVFYAQTVGIFGKATLWMTIIFFVLVLIGLVKSKPKNEYTDIEHGSSDWAEGGEQYKILNKRDGIILAENNYLPLNKLGNINVLVVGRFWIW